MSKKTLLTLLLLLILAAGAAILLKSPGRPAATGASGDILFPGLDLTKVEKMTVAGTGESAAIKQASSVWVVASLYDYPADFPKLAQTVRLLADLKAGSIIRGGTDALADFGLGTDATTVVLLDRAGSPLASLSLGKERSTVSSREGAAFAGGRYLRIGDGPVILVKEVLRGISPRSDDWIDKKILEVNFPLAREVKVMSPEFSYILKVSGENSFELEGLAENEKLDPGAASRVARALQSLRCLTVVDPSRSAADLGLDKPSLFTLTTKDGFAYTVALGGTSAQPEGRYARIAVAYARPAPPSREEVEAALPPEGKASFSPQTAGEAPPSSSDRVEKALEGRLAAYEASCAGNEKKAGELKENLGKWTFVIPNSAVDTLTLSREKLLKKAALAGKAPEPPGTSK